jgi:uncharacterized membrane-anchored protein YhcB (DUF1043 family)
MPWWTWVALAFFLVVGTACAIVAVVLSLRTYRAVRGVQAGLLTAVERLAADAETLAARAERAAERAEEAERRFADVQRSAEQLGVLRWALGDGLDALSRLRQAVPRK